MDELGRVADPRALDASGEASARVDVRVPPAWLGRSITVTTPPRVSCARCDGGGCDACDRRGGFKLDADVAGRTLVAHLPRAIDGGVCLRVPAPFGARGPVAILLVGIRLDEAPSDGVCLVEHRSPPRPRFPAAVAIALVAGVVALVLAFALR